MFFAGCPGVPAVLERPRVQLRAATLVSASAAGLRVRAALDVQNPNAVAMALRAVDWELWVGGAGPMRGRVSASTTLPARGAAPVDVVIEVHPGNAAAMVARIASGARDYRLRAVLHFETRLRDVAVPIDESGELR